MPDPRPLTGLYGKVPLHGDFVRRGLPSSFVGPWDAWLQSGMEAARESLGDSWPAVWDDGAAWRFALPAGACGPDPVAGVMLPSADQVGRRFPLTLAALLPAGSAPPPDAWFDAIENAAQAGRAGQAGADRLAAILPLPGAPLPDGPLLANDPLPGAPPPAWGAIDEPPLPMWDAPAAASDMPAPAADSLAEVTPAEPQDDVLALFAGPAPPEPQDAPRDTDATLTLLIGASEAPRPATAEADPLLALIDAGAEPGEDSADMLPETVAATMLAEPEPAAADPDAAEHPGAPAFTAAAQAPPAPEGGGWWTRGGARMPPTVWALPALPAANDFACLLEAEA